MSEHTPEPWTAFHYEEPQEEAQICGGDIDKDRWMRSFIQGPQKAANARRIVACVNACKGIATEDLECIQDGRIGKFIFERTMESTDARALLRRLVACEGGKWDVERYAIDRAEALEAARAFLAEHGGTE